MITSNGRRSAANKLMRWTAVGSVLAAVQLFAFTSLAAQDPLAGRWDRVGLRHDALRYDIAISLPDSGSRISVRVKTAWRLRAPGSVVLDLDSSLTVRRAGVDGKPVQWRREGNRVVLPLPRSRDSTVTTVIEYDGIPRDGLIIRGNGPDRTAFGDNWPDRARFWLASQDHPADKASVAWDIEAPAAYTVVANGRLERVDTVSSGRRRWSYLNPEPIPTYAMVIGMARMAVTALPEAGCPAHCVPVSVLTYVADSAFALGGPFRRAAPIVDFFSGRIAPFPYGELRHVESTTRFGGMENPTAIFYGEGAYHKGTLSEGTVAHETAHQWFGDAVTESDWHHVWLSEGFATYGAALWAEHAGGDSALRATMAGARTSIMGAAVTERPILDSAVTDRMKLLNTNSYEKGSWVLHTLRGLMGDAAFFRGLSRYFRTYAHRNALSSDFARIMSAEGDQSLAWYFRQALLQPGYPVLDVSTELDGGHLLLTIKQVQKKSWGLYRMPNLEVRLDDRVLRVNIRGTVTRLATHWEGDRPPTVVEVDPTGWWLVDAKPQK